MLLKILHIAKYYEPFKGGIEKVILELAAGSVQAGHEVVVLSSNDKNEYAEDWIEGVKVVRLSRWGVAFSQPLTFSFMWKAKQWMQWCDVVQVHTPNPLAELSFLLQDIQKPLVVTYHCDVVQKRVMQNVYRPVANQLLNRADVITVSTPNHLEYSEILHPHKHKAQVIPFGVRAQHAQKTMEITHKMQELKKKFGDFFLFVGRLVPYKGVDVLLEAMKTVDHNLVIVGGGPRWEAWQGLIQEYQLQDRVTMAGRVGDDTEFAAYLHACTSLVLPSISEAEAFGIVLIEAMACRKPVVTTKLFSGVPWVNDKGVSGLEVPPKDPQALSLAMNQLSQDHDMRKRMEEGARKRFESLFQVDKMVQSYIDLYQTTIDPQKKIAA